MILDETKLASTLLDGEEEEEAPAEDAPEASLAFDGEEEEEAPSEEQGAEASVALLDGEEEGTPDMPAEEGAGDSPAEPTEGGDDQEAGI